MPNIPVENALRPRRIPASRNKNEKIRDTLRLTVTVLPEAHRITLLPVCFRGSVANESNSRTKNSQNACAMFHRGPRDFYTHFLHVCKFEFVTNEDTSLLCHVDISNSQISHDPFSHFPTHKIEKHSEEKKTIKEDKDEYH